MEGYVRFKKGRTIIHILRDAQKGKTICGIRTREVTFVEMLDGPLCDKCLHYKKAFEPDAKAYNGIAPQQVIGCRQKGAFLSGMGAYRTGSDHCPYKGAMLFKYWLAGRVFAAAHPNAPHTLGWRGLLDVIQD